MSDETRPIESPSSPPVPFPPAASAPAPVVAPAAKRRSTTTTLVNVLLGFALVVAVGGVAFAAGRATAPTTTATGRFGGNAANGGLSGGFGPNASGAPNRAFGGPGAGGSIAIQGKVTAVSADSITIQLPSGQDITIPTSDQTTYHSQTSATASDVTTGSDVLVQLSGGGRLVTNGNGNGQGNGNGNGQGNRPDASGAPTRGVGSASSVTVLPAGS